MQAAGTGTSKPAISIVLSTLGSYETLRRVLDGYAEQTVPDDAFELVIVVDAGETDVPAVEAAIGTRDYPVRLERGPVPGLSANRNHGRRVARAPIVMFTDNDTIPLPELVAEHLAGHERHPREETAILGLVRWAPELEVTPFMRWLDTGIQFDYANMSEGDVGWGRFCGANVSLKKSFIERVGDFDQDHFPYGYEDTDWAYRASKLGFQVIYNPRAIVDHLRVMTLEFWKKRARRVAAAEYQFTELHPELPPWFHGKFTFAAKCPPARGRGIKLAPYVPRRTPWLGRKVWDSVDLAYKQELAPHFLEAWEDAASSDRVSSAPNLSEWADA